MQINLSDEMIWVISRCLGWMDETTLHAIRTGSSDYEVDGIEARDLFRELEHDRFGTKHKHGD